MYKIDKKIPCPPRAIHGIWKDVMRSMEVGDSFFVPEADFPGTGARGTASGIFTASKKMGFRMATRSVEGGLRVWRLE